MPYRSSKNVFLTPTSVVAIASRGVDQVSFHRTLPYILIWLPNCLHSEMNCIRNAPLLCFTMWIEHFHELDAEDLGTGKTAKYNRMQSKKDSYTVE